MSELDVLSSIALGVGLAAATGFRVFLPLFVLGLAAWLGHVELGESFAWLGTPPALAMLAAAALVEVAAYYVPGVDNLLDALAAPAAFLAGTLASAAVMVDLPPLVKWTAAVIAGGGAAGILQTVTSTVRLNSTAMTAGAANAFLATAELFGAVFVAMIALAAPLAALSIALGFCWLAVRFLRRRFGRRVPRREE
jgi:hypothetical protein